MSAIERFLEKHPVFSWDEFVNGLGEDRSESTLRSLIRNYLQSGKIGKVKSGLYYRSSETVPDKYLVGSKLAADGILGYHTAFELLGYAHSESSAVYVLTQSRVRPVQFQHIKYYPVSHPAPLTKDNQQMFGTEKIERFGLRVRITGKERTVVDTLDRLDYVGGMEELRRCLEKIPYLDFEILESYLQHRDKKVLFAKVGFLLEQMREDWWVQEEWLDQLATRIPQSPAYLSAEHRGQLLPRWNLIVPDTMLRPLGESA